ncbi:hypothetical protein C8R44DRAFT_51 [Mycena epipterygia]|nr:hypothetical protein C8R44DRAFT_51 [Mycena epipterygia]
MVRMSDPHVAPGKCSLGIVSHRYSPDAMMMEIAMLQIDHHEPVATMSKVFSKNWTTPDLASHHVSDVAVNEKMVAVLLSDYTTAFLLFCAFSDAIIHRIPLGSSIYATDRRGLIYRDDIYVLRQRFDLCAEFGCICTSAALDDLKVVTMTLDIPFSSQGSGIGNSIRIGRSHPRHPKYGILNVTTRTSIGNDVGIHTLHFWPAEVPSSPSDLLDFRPLCFYEHSSSITNLGLGSSGTSVVIVDQASTVGLVQYISQPTTQITFRRLHLPEVEVDDETQIVLDDRLGIVYFHPTQSDTFNIISYA